MKKIKKTKNTPTAWTDESTTAQEVTIEFGPSKSVVTVPRGTLCVKLEGGSPTWVVQDLSFISDKQSTSYWDAEHYGIRVPEEMLTCHRQQIFVLCDIGNLGLLRSLGAEGADAMDYDFERGGINVSVTAEGLTQIEQFPADFNIKQTVSIAPTSSIDMAFTVIGHHASSRELFVEYVNASDALNAFATAAAMHPGAEFSVAIAGHLEEGKEICFPGESLVDSETILEQEDVFGVPQIARSTAKSAALEL